MKKLLATVLLGAIAVSSVCAFTACNPEGEEEQGVTTQVTEDEWKTALSYYTVDWDEQTYYPVLSDNPRTNFKCELTNEYSENGEKTSHIITVEEDYTSQASGIEYVEDDKPMGYYGWKEGEVFYDIGGGWRIDSESGKKIYFYTKSAITEEQFKIGLDSVIYSYAGGSHILALSLADKYEDFTYSEEKEEYTASIYYELYGADAAVTLKFENGMLAYMDIYIAGSQFGESRDTFKYTYGITVTVPDYYLNLQLGENIRD